jgi:hypothetical protein
MRRILALVVFLTVSATPFVSAAQPMGMGPGMHGRGPYGSFCPRWGGPYGTRAPVQTADEARQVIEAFFSGQGQAITVGKMEELRWYFQAEVLDKNGRSIDLVIVDKRTGRLRSIYWQENPRRNISASNLPAEGSDIREDLLLVKGTPNYYPKWENTCDEPRDPDIFSWLAGIRVQRLGSR